MNEDRPILAATMTLVFENIRYMRGFLLTGSRGPHVRVGLSTTAIFADLSSYFFGNFTDKASNIV